ncbi:hypothetical protein IFM89_035791 [Coptis chinensis]|uniref:Uncharacterized protein n=1 Tax=Coptis chinensis TaxID=261450 RepID=A0A835I5U3_9MAGN|nr:hypothetical protein IFM89_035791 [Coptis chinensis]
MDVTSVEIQATGRYNAHGTIVYNNKMCGGERSLKTTQNGLNTGRKYLKCSLCISFEWLSDAMREARQKTEKFDPTVTIKMALSNFAKMSLK